MSDNIPQPHMVSITEAYRSDSDEPIIVLPRQIDEKVARLSPEDFRKASQLQKQRDAAYEAAKGNSRIGTPTPSPQSVSQPIEPRVFTNDPPPSKDSPAEGVRPSGKRSPGRPRTLPPTPPKPVGNKSQPRTSKPVSDPRVEELDLRMKRMEHGQERLMQGFDKLVGMLADQHAQQGLAVQSREENEAEGVPDGMLRYHPEQEEEFDDDEGDCAILGEGVVAGDDSDKTDHGPATAERDNISAEGGDPSIIRLQRYIQLHNPPPLKDFRRFWAQLCPKAGFQEWPQPMQERFTELFHNIIVHPKMLHQVRKSVKTFRNGQVLGDEQLYRMLMVMAGSCALYTIITQGS